MFLYLAIWFIALLYIDLKKKIKNDVKHKKPSTTDFIVIEGFLYINQKPHIIQECGVYWEICYEKIMKKQNYYIIYTSD